MAEETRIDYMRQMGLFNPNISTNQPSITVVGAGNTGSWSVLALAKIGFHRITVYDGDKVEPHNAPNQLYSHLDSGDYKVLALTELMRDLTGVEILPVIEMVSSTSDISSDIWISAVDSMAVRKDIWTLAKSLSPQGTRCAQLFIDGRLGGNVCTVYSVPMNSTAAKEQYEKTLHDDSLSHIANEEVRRASELDCTTRAIADVSFIMAGLVSSAVRRFMSISKVVPETTVDLLNGTSW